MKEKDILDVKNRYIYENGEKEHQIDSDDNEEEEDQMTSDGLSEDDTASEMSSTGFTSDDNLYTTLKSSIIMKTQENVVKKWGK